MPDDRDRINMRLHEVERVFYDPRADSLVTLALDDDTLPEDEARWLREAEKIFSRARARVVQTTNANMKRLAEVLRRMGA